MTATLTMIDRSRSLSFLFLFLSIAVLPQTLHAQPRGGRPEIPAQSIAEARDRGTTRVIVRLDVGLTPEAQMAPADVATQRTSIARAQQTVLARMQRVDPSSVHRFSYIPFFAAELDEGDLATLAASPEVSAIEVDRVAHPTLAQSTPLIGATRAWAAGYTGAGWTVAVLDTGVDAAHPFLSGKVVSEACYSTTIAGRSSSVCPGGAPSSTATGSGAPCALADCTHGTHVAGIAAGRGTTFSGVARDASLIAVQVFSTFTRSSDCGTPPCALSFSSDRIRGLERVYALRTTYKIAAVNMSIGGGGYTTPCDVAYGAEKAIIDQLRAANIATVIASGNDGYINALSGPACISTAISVGSTTDSADQVSYFSNTSQYLSLFAPGELITSSVPGGGFANKQGTSMAAPHVAGAWALLKSRKASASVDELLAALSATGTPVLDPYAGIVKPRINLDLALQRLPLPCTYTVVPTRVNVGWQSGSTSISVSAPANCPWNATSPSSFVVVTSGQSGSGTGSVVVSYSPNPNSVGREGLVMIAGTTVTIAQQGAPLLPDVNGDGRADLFWQHLTQGWLATWSLSGSNVTGTQLLGIDRVTDTNWQIVGSGDLNGDGATDLVWRHKTSGWLAVWFLKGTEVVNIQYLSINQVADLGWQVAAVGDIDGDGKADLIWQDATTGGRAAWLMNGAQVVTTVFLSISQVADTDWQIVGAGDANGDGYADLIWQHRTQGSLAVWFMRGATVLGTEFLSINRLTDLNWHIRGVGDVDGDRRTDIIWQNDATGELGVWMLNGSVVVNTRVLSIDRVDDLGWRVVGPG